MQDWDCLRKQWILQSCIKPLSRSNDWHNASDATLKSMRYNLSEQKHNIARDIICCVLKYCCLEMQ